MLKYKKMIDNIRNDLKDALQYHRSEVVGSILQSLQSKIDELEKELREDKE